MSALRDQGEGHEWLRGYRHLYVSGTADLTGAHTEEWRPISPADWLDGYEKLTS